MAKKGNRQIFMLECSSCKNRNYITQKNVVNSKDKLSFDKFCRHCRKVTPHAEAKVK